MVNVNNYNQSTKRLEIYRSKYAAFLSAFILFSKMDISHPQTNLLHIWQQRKRFDFF